MNAPFLIGERIYLRPLEESDLDRCLRWINDPEILATLGRRFPMNRTRETEWLVEQYKSETSLLLAIALKDKDQHIGNCGLHHIDYPNGCATFGMLIGEKNEWGKEYAPEATRLILDFAFNQLRLHRVSLEVYAHNRRGQRAYEKVGFVREGVLRESYFRNGRYYDTVVMGLLQSEWKRE